jgi:hypothetical protein
MTFRTVTFCRFGAVAALVVLGAGSYAPGAASHDVNAQEQAAYRPLQLLLDGLSQRDEELMRAQLMPGFRATLMRDKKPLELDREAFLGRLPKSGKETLLEKVNDPLVKIDDNVAMIWAPYVFYIDGKRHHCGTNVVNVVNVDGRWLISAVADTARSNCE